MYENGVFRPLKRPEGIAEHRQVTLTVTAEDKSSSLADFAGRIAPDDAEEMLEIVEREFEPSILVSGNSVALDTSVATAVRAGQAGTLLSQSLKKSFVPFPSSASCGMAR